MSWRRPWSSVVTVHSAVGVLRSGCFPGGDRFGLRGKDHDQQRPLVDHLDHLGEVFAEDDVLGDDGEPFPEVVVGRCRSQSMTQA